METYINKSTRFPIDFGTEMKCLSLHKKHHKKDSFKNIIKHVYIPKFNVKRYSPYLYAGEKAIDYFNMRSYQTSNKDARVRLGEHADSTRLILGIESSFDDSCAGIVSSSGQVLANEKRQFLDNVNSENAPIRAEKHHE